MFSFPRTGVQVDSGVGFNEGFDLFLDGFLLLHVESPDSQALIRVLKHMLENRPGNSLCLHPVRPALAPVVNGVWKVYAFQAQPLVFLHGGGVDIEPVVVKLLV